MQKLLCLVTLSIFLIAAVSGRNYCQRYLIKKQNGRVRNWEDAKMQCERRGMSLVKIDHMEEDAFLRTLLEGENLGFRADGWFIGGVYRNGRWEWSDGSPMNYQNFPSTGRLGFNFQDVTNYAFIMKNGYQWGYVSPFGTQKMGYICESTTC